MTGDPPRRTWRRALPGVLGLALLQLACAAGGASAPDVVVHASLSPDPPIVGPARLDIRLQTGAGAAVDAARVRVEGHMTHPGMTPVLAEAVPRGSGAFDARLDFTMRGDWVVLVVADLPDGRRVQHPVSVRVVEPEE